MSITFYLITLCVDSADLHISKKNSLLSSSYPLTRSLVLEVAHPHRLGDCPKFGMVFSMELRLFKYMVATRVGSPLSVNEISLMLPLQCTSVEIAIFK